MGELMSRYTNDTDTLREMISEGIPQLISSVITVVGVFSMMLVLSWQLTILAVLLLMVLLRLVKRSSAGNRPIFSSSSKERWERSTAILKR